MIHSRNSFQKEEEMVALMGGGWRESMTSDLLAL